MKFLILILAGIAATVYIRTGVTDLGKGMYFEGCSDASLKLERLGKIEESKTIARFCTARKKAIDEHVTPF